MSRATEQAEPTEVKEKHSQPSLPGGSDPFADVRMGAGKSNVDLTPIDKLLPGGLPAGSSLLPLDGGIQLPVAGKIAGKGGEVIGELPKPGGKDEAPGDLLPKPGGKNELPPGFHYGLDPRTGQIGVTPDVQTLADLNTRGSSNAPDGYHYGVDPHTGKVGLQPNMRTMEWHEPPPGSPMHDGYQYGVDPRTGQITLQPMLRLL